MIRHKDCLSSQFLIWNFILVYIVLRTNTILVINQRGHKSIFLVAEWDFIGTFDQFKAVFASWFDIIMKCGKANFGDSKRKSNPILFFKTMFHYFLLFINSFGVADKNTFLLIKEVDHNVGKIYRYCNLYDNNRLAFI